MSQADGLPACWRDHIAADAGAPAASETWRVGVATMRAARRAAPATAGDSLRPLAELGRGGRGIVFRALQESLQREVALKKLLPGQATPEQRRRFVGEARIGGRLEHPNIVPVYDVGPPAEEPWLTMPLIAGRSWQEARAEDGGELEAQVGILLQVCDAVGFAHSRGIIHNDIKPANVLLGDFGEVLLADWGLALCFEPEGDGLLPSTAELEGPRGTPAYMSPELALGQGESLGPASDIYLVGAVLCELLSGQPPHRGDTLLDVVASAAEGRLPNLPEDLPALLRRCCLRAMDPRPERRQASVAELASELRAFLEHGESLRISAAAQVQMDRCATPRPGEVGRSGVYQQLSEAVAGFTRAQQLWPGNNEARDGELKARRTCTEFALAAGDFGMARTQLQGLQTASGDGCPELQRRIARAERDREREQTRLRRLRLGLGGALLAVLLGLLAGIAAVDQGNALVAAETVRVALERDLAQQRGQIAAEALERMVQSVYLLRHETRQSPAQGTMRVILQAALEGWTELLHAEVDPGRISLGKVRAYLHVAGLRWALDGDLAASLREFDEAAKLAREVVNAPKAHPEALRLLAEALRGKAGILASSGRLPEAAELCQSALALSESAGSDDLALATRVDCLLSAAQISSDRGQLSAAVHSARQALEIFHQLEDPDGTALSTHGRVLYELAGVLQNAGALDEALEWALAGLELRRTVLQNQPSPWWQDRVGDSLMGVAEILFALGRQPQAAPYAEEALDLARFRVERSPEDAHARTGLVEAQQVLARILLRLGFREDAQPLFQEALSAARQLALADTTDLVARFRVTEVARSYAHLMLTVGRLDEAEQLMAEQMDGVVFLIGADPENADYQRAWSSAYLKRGDLAFARRDFEAAIAAFQRTQELAAALVGRDYHALCELADATRLEAVAWKALEKPEESLRKLEAALEIRRYALLETPADLHIVREQLGSLILSWRAWHSEQPALAEAWAREIEDLAGEAADPVVRLRLADFLYERGSRHLGEPSPELVTAWRELSKSAQLWQSLLEQEPRDFQLAQGWARCQVELAECAAARGRWADARTSVDTAIPLLRDLRQAAPEEPHLPGLLQRMLELDRWLREHAQEPSDGQ